MEDKVDGFYFNGEPVSLWARAWNEAGIPDLLGESDAWDEELGYRDVWMVTCKIDHTGTVESADPDEFLYVVQEVALLLLNHRERALGSLKTVAGDPEAAFRELVDGLFQMRELLQEKRIAFWCSGDEELQAACLERMERSSLSASDPRHLPPPHIEHQRRLLKGLLEVQAKSLHALAHSRRFDRALRKELLR